METIYDWLTVLLFGALAVLYLQRSAADEPTDRVWHYLPPAIGCAAANYLGNHGQGILAVVIIVLVMVYVFYVLRPRIGA
ncbi:MAG: XrtV sorting system accessory protein [Pseudomonadota bacterium]